MSSGRSSSDHAATVRAQDSTARAPFRPGGVARRLAPAALALSIGVLPAQEPIPSPPENPGSAPPPSPAPRTTVPQAARCLRCGYLCEPGWRHCMACGWDLTTLVGGAEEERLQTIGRATVGVIVSGLPNRHATAFPFGDAGLMLTDARALIGSDDFSISVRTHNDRSFQAEVVGYDLPSGVGVIRASIPGLPRLEIAPSSPAPPGKAWAVCYPVAHEDDTVRHLPVSLHRGHLTGTGQSGTFYVSFENLLRSDHAIEPGCAGGPLVDAQGRLAGLILASPDDGITYAVPIEEIAPIAATLSLHEQPVRPFFGLGLVMPDERRRARFAIGPGSSHPLVAYLIPGSPASTAGVRAGDLLVAVAGEPVTTVRDAGTRLLGAAPGGPPITLSLLRGGTEHQAPVTPVRRPLRVLLDPIDEIEESLEANLTPAEGGRGAPQGLRVADLVRGGRGEKGRFRDGDVIVSVDRKTVKSAEAFNTHIRTKFGQIFAAGDGRDRQFASSYVVDLKVRTWDEKRVTRRYVNLFPDFLAPPVY